MAGGHAGGQDVGRRMAYQERHCLGTPALRSTRSPITEIAGLISHNNWLSGEIPGAGGNRGAGAVAHVRSQNLELSSGQFAVTPAAIRKTTSGAFEKAYYYCYLTDGPL